MTDTTHTVADAAALVFSRHHWHYDADNSDGEYTGLWVCDESPCLRSDMAYVVTPICGPVGVFITDAVLGAAGRSVSGGETG